MNDQLIGDTVIALGKVYDAAYDRGFQAGLEKGRTKPAWAAFLEARARLIHEWTGVKSDDQIAFDLSMDGPFQVKLIRGTTKNEPAG
jgi:hypothetical protein